MRRPPATTLTDGVDFPTFLLRDSTVNITVTASSAGLLDAWLDFNKAMWRLGRMLVSRSSPVERWWRREIP